MSSIPRMEHPRPDFERKNWLNLNGTWDFAFSESNTAPAFDRTIVVPFSWASPLSEIEEDRTGTGWYHRRVAFSCEGDVNLVIGAADYETLVYINGTLSARHTGGYGEIRVNVTPYWDKNGDNDVVIRVTDYDRDNQTRGKQGYGEIRGIWQTVYVEEVPATHLEHFKIETKCDGKITVKAVIFAEKEGKTTLCAAFDGKKYEKEVKLEKGHNEKVLNFVIDNPKLWSCDEPNLYEGAISVGKDAVSTYFGIREISWAHFDGKSFPWITLNGKPIYLNGTLDQSFNPKGFFTLPSEDEVRSEVRRMKEVGLNMARLHIKPEEPRKLFWMDKLGVLAFADMVCYWGEPTAETKMQYEKELWEFITRDCNHPCIMTWVIFNETWGLFTHLPGQTQRVYLPETQEWVRRLYKQVKGFDGTRIVEDNSACNNDHVETDLNTWHFYRHGYMTVKEEIDNAAKKAYAGSSWNFINGNEMSDIPFMNSECGMVWGVEGNAGDSDIAWQYHYMLNEFRLQENLCGFVFTEFHDVINEFNGYFRIDNTRKDFGYDELGMGMDVKDLHTPDFIAYDAAPCRTVGGGEEVATKIFYSSFGGAEKGTSLTLEWHLNGVNGEYAKGQYEFAAPGNGLTALPDITVAMPAKNEVCALTFILKDGEKVLAKNFCTFDVRGARQGISFTRPKDAEAKGFTKVWKAIAGQKLDCAGEGVVSLVIPVDSLGENDYELVFEASAKRLLAKDNDGVRIDEAGADYMGGYKVDPGQNRNSYFMSDETRFPASLTVSVEGEKFSEITLPNDPADARGVLSFQYQPRERFLNDFGSYGYLCSVPVTGVQIEKAKLSGGLHVTLSTDKGGLALYGRNAGRYPIDIELIQK